MRRIVVTVVISAALLVAGATPAFAHTVAGTGATNYKTTLTKRPTIAGLKVRIIEAGSRFEATYSGTQPVYVMGYQEEQYLRIDGRGVFENLKSPATYINRSRDGENPPGDADPKAKPVWQKVSSGRTARFHDHRIHFMGDINPPQVRNAPGERHVIVPNWKIPFTQGTTTSNAQGSLVWIPGPSVAPFAITAVALIVGLVVWTRRTAPYLPVLIATALLVLVSVVHAFAIGFANAGTVPQQFAQAFSSSTVAIPAWIVGAGAVWFLMRRRVDGFFAAVFAGLIIAVVGGFADLTVLSRSVVPSALPAGATRVIVTLSLGLGLGVAAASGLAIRSLDPKPASASVD